MLECRSCREYIRGNRETVGARCPSCRMSLYERPVEPRPMPAYPSSEEAACPLHAGNLAGSTCQRCGNFVCDVCRTRWQGRLLCTACIERFLEGKDVIPERARTHRRQAVLSLVLGLCGWGMLILAILIVVGASTSRDAVGFAAMAVLMILFSFVPSLFGAGQGAAALRSRGDRMILATSGLVLCCIHVGAMVGLLLFSIYSA